MPEDYGKRLYGEGWTPYRDARRWRRRFWFVLAIDAVLSGLLMLALLHHG